MHNAMEFIPTCVFVQGSRGLKTTLLKIFSTHFHLCGIILFHLIRADVFLLLQ